MVAATYRAVLAEHPNTLSLFASRPAVTPASLRHVEEAFDVLRSHGFSARGALTVFQTMVAYVVGHTLATFAPASEKTVASPRYDALDATTFPRVKEIAKLLGSRDLDQEFTAGLDAMIDGFDTRRG